MIGQTIRYSALMGFGASALALSINPTALFSTGNEAVPCPYPADLLAVASKEDIRCLAEKEELTMTVPNSITLPPFIDSIAAGLTGDLRAGELYLKFLEAIQAFDEDRPEYADQEKSAAVNCGNILLFLWSTFHEACD